MWKTQEDSWLCEETRIIGGVWVLSRGYFGHLVFFPSSSAASPHSVLSWPLDPWSLPSSWAGADPLFGEHLWFTLEAFAAPIWYLLSEECEPTWLVIAVLDSLNPGYELRSSALPGLALQGCNHNCFKIVLDASAANCDLLQWSVVEEDSKPQQNSSHFIPLILRYLIPPILLKPFVCTNDTLFSLM